jgi:tagatose-1,6-bisphosphate aldolase non-catalytic subunit AgaZ/GatZ
MEAHRNKPSNANIVLVAFGNMLRTLNQKPLPDALLKQYVPELTLMLLKTGALTPEKILYLKIQNVLDDYAQAVKP